MDYQWVGRLVALVVLHLVVHLVEWSLARSVAYWALKLEYGMAVQKVFPSVVRSAAYLAEKLADEMGV